MFSLTRNVHQSRARDLDSLISVKVDRLDFRSALVIEESTVLRSSIVQFLKRRGWIAHGIRSAGQALPLLKCIPYHLIVIDGSASSLAAINFARTLHNSEEWNRIPLVIITDSPNASLASNLMEAGVHSARRGAWLSDLTQILSELEVHGRWRKQIYAS
jgi:DNA-binding NtrC family response regulator